MFQKSTVSILGVAATTMLFLLSACSQAPTDHPNTNAPLSTSPAGDYVFTCVTAKGWDVKLEWDGSIVADSTTIPKEQLELYTADVEECTDKATQKFAVPKGQLPALYDAERKTLNCLRDNGFPNISDPPSEQAFLDMYDSNPWTAYSGIDLASMGDKEWKELNIACPQPLVTFDGSFE